MEIEVKRDGGARVRLPILIERLLKNRGYEGESLRLLLNPSFKILKDPNILHDMDLAVGRLVKAFENEEKICIYADYDLDGTSGSVLLQESLLKLGFRNVEIYQPDRFREGYGLKINVVENLAAKGVSLIITVDLGITANKEVKRAQELNVDVIVTDHHLPSGDLPKAVAVVNPNKGICESGLGHLCGTGVAFYLVMALKRAMIAKNLASDSDLDLKSLLDLFCIGTLTDMVPLKDENRVLVRHGLSQLAKTQRPGFRALMASLAFDGGGISSAEVGFKIAPKLNALSRMDTSLKPIDLYTVSDLSTAKSWVQEVMQTNDLRKSYQSMADKLAAEFLASHQVENFVWLYSDQIHRGIMGLVATKVTSQTGLPSFVGHITEAGTIVGSARAPSISSLDLTEILESCASSLHQYGGHAKAAGFELDQLNAEKFRRALKDYFASRTEGVKKVEWQHDGVARLAEISTDFMNWLVHLEPFGNGFPVPSFHLTGQFISNSRLLKGNHLKLTLVDPNDKKSMDAIWFSPPSGKDYLFEFGANTRVDCWVQPQWNEFQGRKTIQLLIQDMVKTAQ